MLIEIAKTSKQQTSLQSKKHSRTQNPQVEEE
jgi:hypothetical protein